MWIMALNEHRLLNIPSDFNVNNGIEWAQTFEYTFPLQFNVNNAIKRAQTFEYSFPLQCE